MCKALPSPACGGLYPISQCNFACTVAHHIIGPGTPSICGWCQLPPSPRPPGAKWSEAPSCLQENNKYRSFQISAGFFNLLLVDMFSQLQLSSNRLTPIMPPKTRRLGRFEACLSCHARKTKCTGGRPCYLCMLNGRECEYNPPGQVNLHPLRSQ